MFYFEMKEPLKNKRALFYEKGVNLLELLYKNLYTIVSN